MSDWAKVLYSPEGEDFYLLNLATGASIEFVSDEVPPKELRMQHHVGMGSVSVNRILEVLPTLGHARNAMKVLANHLKAVTLG